MAKTYLKGSRGCCDVHCNSLWSVWYGLLAFALQAYIVYKVSKRQLRHSTLGPSKIVISLAKVVKYKAEAAVWNNFSYLILVCYYAASVAIYLLCKVASNIT